MNSRARKKQAEMHGNSLGVVLSSGGLAAAERSEGSPPGEPQRSEAAAKAGADSGAVSRPDPEVVAKAKRRTYTAEYKRSESTRLNSSHRTNSYAVFCLKKKNKK